IAKICTYQMIIEIGLAIALRGDYANLRFAQHVHRCPANEHRLRLNAGSIVLILPDHQRTEIPVADAAADLGTHIDINRRTSGAEANIARKEWPAILPRRVRNRLVAFLAE